MAPPPAEAQSLPAHEPIILNGDGDLCDEVDATGRLDVADGISNCDVADGSPEAPYVIERFAVTVAGCPVACTNPPPCTTSDIPAAVSICNTTKHILVRGLEIRNEEAVRSAQPSTSGGISQVYAAGMNLAGVENVRVESTQVFAAGQALAVGPGRGAIARPVRNLEFENVSLQGLTTEGGGRADAVADIRRADVRFFGVTIDASGYQTALSFNSGHPTGEAPHEFTMTGSTVQDAAQTGVDIDNYRAFFQGNVFQRNGVVPSGQGNVYAAVQPGGGRDLWLQSGTYDVINNTFSVYGAAIDVQYAAGRIQHNVFTSPNQQTGTAASTAIYQAISGSSTARISYNDFNSLRIVNQDTVHEINAAFNYWGQPGGPGTNQRGGEGSVAATPWLRMPVRDLPTVTVLTPSPGTPVHGRFLVGGVSNPNKAPQLERVEATFVEDSWAVNETAAGIETWELSFDASGEPLGPFTVWVRACWNDGCGVPARLDLTVVEQPLPPIALLEANPRVASAGDEIILDASFSYSPQSRPIAAYRYDLGNGVKTAWVAESTYSVRYPAPGEFPVSVEVLDLSGLASTNLPQIVLRIRGGSGDDAANPLPGPETTPLLVAAAALALFRRRRA